jgi:undecaprenyl-diphosphatase
LITGIIGAPLYIVADSLKDIPLGVPMLIIGFVLILDALLIRYSRKKKVVDVATRKFGELKLRDYVFIGIAQGIAALPGVSRSGITTSTMLLMKVEADEAFRLSFLVGIFAALGAFGLTLVATNTNVSIAIASIGTAGLLIAIVTSTVVSLFLIDFLIKIAGKSKIVYVTGALGVIAIAGGVLYMAFGI